jgi:uncharacterized OB-fold protein
MAMTKCGECGAAISTRAVACPECGAKPKKKTGVLTWLVAGILGLSVIMAAVDLNRAGEKKAEQAAAAAAVEAAKSPEQKASEAAAKVQAEAEFQRVVGVLRALKATQKDPDSFEVEGAVLMPSGAVCVTHRGRNSFNAKVVDQTVVSSAGKVGDWNKLCANKTGTNYRHARQAL